MQLQKVQYTQLNSKQKENFNFYQIAAKLAEYGFASIRIGDDWNGADFYAHHIDGRTSLRIQLKSRLTFDKKYLGKDLYIAFPFESDWYLYPHDELFQHFPNIQNSGTWRCKGQYSYNHCSRAALSNLEHYKL